MNYVLSQNDWIIKINSMASNKKKANGGVEYPKSIWIWFYV